MNNIFKLYKKYYITNKNCQNDLITRISWSI